MSVLLTICLYFNALLASLLLLTYLYVKFHIFNHWKRKRVDFIPPTFPFGNFRDVLFGKKSMGVTVADIYKVFKSKGVLYGGYFAFNQPVFTTTSPELVRNITCKDFSHFEERGPYYDEEVDPLSGHLFSIRNPRWYKLRMKFSPTFTQARLKAMYQTMVDCSTDLKTVLQTPARTSEPVDIKDILERFTTDIISSCAFGLQCNSLKYPDAEIRKAGHEFFKGSLRNSLVITLASQAPGVLKFFKIPICKPSVAKYFLDAIRYAIEEREKHKIERNDMIQLMIKLKNNEDIEDEGKKHRKIDDGITFNEIAAHMFVFLLGGFETSASALTFGLYELSLAQDIQERLRKEVMETLKKHGGELTYDCLSEMEYMDQVVHEILRKYPSIPVINRECSKDYTVPGTDIVLEKGTKVVISGLGMMRDPENYPDPEKFDPERFSEKRKGDVDFNTFLPFGLGPRNCIGYRFGLLQIKIGLAVLLRNFKFGFDEKTKFPLELNTKTFIMAFKDVLYLRVTEL